MRKLILLLLFISSIAIAQYQTYDSAKVDSATYISEWKIVNGNFPNRETLKRLVAVFIDSTLSADSMIIEVSTNGSDLYDIYSSNNTLGWAIDTTKNWAIPMPPTSTYFLHRFRFKFPKAYSDTMDKYIKFETWGY